MKNVRDEQLYLFYDPNCALCMRFKDWIIGQDDARQISLVELREGIEERFPHVDFVRAADQLTACDRQGYVYEGMAALRQVVRYLPSVARLRWIYDLPGVAQMATGVYRTVHRVRKRLCLRCGGSWMLSGSKRRRARGARGRQR